MNTFFIADPHFGHSAIMTYENRPFETVEEMVEPLYTNTNMPYANIFGHVHASKQYTDYSSQSFCVSVERIDYTPIEFEEIKRLMGIMKPEEE